MDKIKYYLIVLACLGTFQSQAQVKYSNEFLSIGVGARSFGMGGSVVGSVNDVTANFWNPAGLSRIESGLQLGAMHAIWYSGVGNYDYIAIAKPLNDNRSALSLGIIRFGIDGIPNTLDLLGPDGSIDYDNIREFSAVDYGIFGSYARKLNDPKWNIGGSVKVVRRTLGSFANSIGFGIDLGIQHTGEKVFWGIMGKDISTTFNSWKATFTDKEKEILQQTGNDVLVKGTEITNPTFILAGGIKTALGKNGGLLAELDVDMTTDGKRNVLISASPVSFNPHLGLEYDYKQLFFLRGGVNNIQQVVDETNGDKKSWTLQPNFGLGIMIGPVMIDYALANIGNVADTRLSHIFSLRLDFKPSPKE